MTPPADRPSRAEAEAAVRTLLRWACDDPTREGLLDTPSRVVRSYEEFFAGYATDPVAMLFYARSQKGDDGCGDRTDQTIEEALAVLDDDGSIGGFPCLTIEVLEKIAGGDHFILLLNRFKNWMRKCVEPVQMCACPSGESSGN